MGSIHPLSMRRQLTAIMAGALAPRTLAAVSVTSHHRQWNRVSFKISGMEGRFYSNSLKIGIAR
jgi:hypothetical protein